MRDFSDDDKVTVWHCIAVTMFCIFSSYILLLLDLAVLATKSFVLGIVFVPIWYLLLVLRR